MPSSCRLQTSFVQATGLGLQKACSRHLTAHKLAMKAATCPSCCRAQELAACKKVGGGDGEAGAAVGRGSCNLTCLPGFAAALHNEQLLQRCGLICFVAGSKQPAALQVCWFEQPVRHCLPHGSVRSVILVVKSQLDTISQDGTSCCETYIPRCTPHNPLASGCESSRDANLVWYIDERKSTSMIVNTKRKGVSGLLDML